MTMIVLIYVCCYGVHAGKKLQSMANQYRLGNRQNEERSPYRDPIYLRLFGTNISIIPTTTQNALEGNNTSHFINGGSRSVSSISARDNMTLSSLYPAIGGQTGVAPVVGYNYQASGAVAGNSSNANSNDKLCRVNSSFKRSRSPDTFTRGETSNQGSQIDGRFNRRRTLPPPPSPTSASLLYPLATTRGAGSSSSQATSFSQDGDNNNTLDFFDTSIQQGMDDAYVESTTDVQQHGRLLREGRVNQIPSPAIVHVWPINFAPPRQPIRTSDPSSSNYQLTPSPSLPGSGLTIDVPTIQFIQTSSGLPRSETVIRSSGSYHNLISTPHELLIEMEMLRVEVYILS